MQCYSYMRSNCSYFYFGRLTNWICNVIWSCIKDLLCMHFSSNLVFASVIQVMAWEEKLSKHLRANGFSEPNQKTGLNISAGLILNNLQEKEHCSYLLFGTSPKICNLIYSSAPKHFHENGSWSVISLFYFSLVIQAL